MKNRQMNFIPVDIREKFVIPHKFFPMIIATAVFLYVSISGISLYRNHSSALTELAQLEVKNTELLAKLKNENVSEQEIAGANSLQDLLKKRKNWSDIFKEMSLLIPDGVWLTGFGNTVKAEKSGKPSPLKEGENLILRGEAGSQASIAEFLATLEQSRYFASARLNFTEKEADIKPTRYTFEFYIPVRNPASGGKVQ